MSIFKHNIYFKVGQPNTGKSHGFSQTEVKNCIADTGYRELKYKKVSVSGGEGNEFRGLQSSDLAISFDPVNSTIVFGSLLKAIMQAISKPEDIHVYFLDDFHNQKISSLLSEFTPLLKPQNAVQNYKDSNADIEQIKTRFPELFNDASMPAEQIISLWNSFVSEASDILKVDLETVTNKVTGQDISLYFPDNFYLFGAANFNDKTLNIYSDWQARAHIEYIDPLDTIDYIKDTHGENEFYSLLVELNLKVRDYLEMNEYFAYKSICFGFWGYFNNGNEIEGVEAQKDAILNATNALATSLKQNHLHDHINGLGSEILQIILRSLWYENNSQPISLQGKEQENLYNIGMYEFD